VATTLGMAMIPTPEEKETVSTTTVKPCKENCS